jgi:photosystem II stability/assembly factor-like uncharacterized protein
MHAHARIIRVILALLFALPAVARAQWQLLDPPTTADLRGIDNVGGGVAWASGTGGTVVRTEDGGYMWQHCSIPPGAEKLDFRGIQAFDANTAIVMSSGPGDQSRIYKTTDGCQSWQLVFTNPDPTGFWDALRFDKASLPDKCFGTLVGDPVSGHFPIFLTFDCGDKWERQIRESPAALPSGEGLFAASNSSLVISASSLREIVTGGKGGARRMYFWVGRDDTMQPDPLHVAPGANAFHYVSRGWNVESLPDPTPAESSGAFSIAHGNDKVVIVGGDYSQPAKGMAWYEGSYNAATKSPWRLSNSPPHGYRSAVAYDPGKKIWITVGPNGTDISTDDGRTWQPLHTNTADHDAPDADQHWNALSLPFVVGPQGRVGKLRNDALPEPSKTRR